MFGNVYIGIFLLLNGIVIGLTLCFMFSACFQKSENDETVLILGCGLYGSRPSRALMQRMDRAIQYLNISPVSNVIVSGGQGRNEDISEAEALGKLTAHLEDAIVPDTADREDILRPTRHRILFLILRHDGLNTLNHSGCKPPFHVLPLRCSTHHSKCCEPAQSEGTEVQSTPISARPTETVPLSCRGR